MKLSSKPRFQRRKKMRSLPGWHVRKSSFQMKMKSLEGSLPKIIDKSLKIFITTSLRPVSNEKRYGGNSKGQSRHQPKKSMVVETQTHQQFRSPVSTRMPLSCKQQNQSKLLLPVSIGKIA